MSKLITVPIDFISIEDLTTQYQNNLEINFDNLGIIADQRTILSQILYTEYKLYRNPYKLMVNKNTYQSERKKSTRQRKRADNQNGRIYKFRGYKRG